RRLRQDRFRRADRAQRGLLGALSRAGRGDAAVIAHHSPGAGADAGRTGQGQRPQGGAAAARRDEAVDGSADPSFQALHRGLPRPCRGDLHGGRGAEGRVRRLSRVGRHQSAVSLQDPCAGLRDATGDRVPVARSHAGRSRRDHRLDGHRFRRDRPVNATEGQPVAQPESFEFTPENLERAQVHIAKYPPGRQASGVLPLLDLAQRQMGWVPRAAMDYVAGLLGMAPIRVYEVATFYTMFNLRPVGKYLLQACTTTPCWLRGSDDVVAACERRLGIHMGGTTEDGLFTLVEVECLGACVNAPILQVNDDFYEDLDGPATEALLDALRDGKSPAVGSLAGRPGSAPANGKTTLTEPPQPPPWQTALTSAEPDEK